MGHRGPASTAKVYVWIQLQPGITEISEMTRPLHTASRSGGKYWNLIHEMLPNL